jgi:hypothetical protein
MAKIEGNGRRDKEHYDDVVLQNEFLQPIDIE